MVNENIENAGFSESTLKVIAAYKKRVNALVRRARRLEAKHRAREMDPERRRIDAQLEELMRSLSRSS